MSYKDRLSKLILGGAHTYSRGDDQYPSNAPTILEKGRGYVWDPRERVIWTTGWHCAQLP